MTQEIDSGANSPTPTAAAKTLMGLTPAEARARALESHARRFSILRATKPERVIRMLEGVPKTYRGRLVKVLAGEGSAREEIRANCEQCVGWEDVPERIGGCSTLSCAFWLKRPYQAKNVFPEEGSTASAPSLPRFGMIVGGECFELATWERLTLENAGGFWPTPTARDYKSPGVSRSRRALEKNRYSFPLSVAFKIKYGYRLPASFVEYLMGYVPQHTVCAPWAMQWFQSVRAKRSAASQGSGAGE